MPNRRPFLSFACQSFRLSRSFRFHARQKFLLTNVWPFSISLARWNCPRMDLNKKKTIFLEINNLFISLIKFRNNKIAKKTFWNIYCVYLVCYLINTVNLSFLELSIYIYYKWYKTKVLVWISFPIYIWVNGTLLHQYSMSV